MKNVLRSVLKLLLVAGFILAILFGFCLWENWVWLQNAPKTFSKPNAEREARKHLAQYAAEHHIPIREFKGPYFEETLGLDFPTYIVCYAHPRHYFCYDDWKSDVLARPLEPGEPAEVYKPPQFEGPD